MESTSQLSGITKMNTRSKMARSSRLTLCGLLVMMIGLASSCNRASKTAIAPTRAKSPNGTGLPMSASISQSQTSSDPEWIADIKTYDPLYRCAVQAPRRPTPISLAA